MSEPGSQPKPISAQKAQVRSGASEVEQAASSPPNADRPIRRRTDDLLDRAGFGDALASEILRAPSDGYVIAVTGAWGSGKTSVINIALETLGSDKVWILRFNPWLFSGTEQLVTSFFRELSSQLLERNDGRLKTLSKRLENYGEVVGPLGTLPVIGSWIAGSGAVARVAATILRRGRTASSGSAEAQRYAIEADLRALPKRLLVVIDDIDRLQAGEIADVMRLVRLIADFPNVVYVLAFDRERVEEALGTGNRERGREHLEKITQATFQVPSLRSSDLARVLLEELQGAVENVQAGPFDPNHWQNVFAFVVQPLFGSMRDVRRYVNAVPHALATVGEEVALTDVLALEAVRSAVPEVIHRMPDLVESLTGVTDPASVRDERIKQHRTKQLQELIEAAGPHRREIEEMCRVLFPASQRYLGNTFYGPDSSTRWRKERLVANESVLRFYLERSLPQGVLGAATVQRLFESLTDETRLRAELAAMDPETLEHALTRLEDYEDSFPPESVPIALPVVLDTLPRLREGNRAMFDPGPSIRVTRVALRLLRRVEDEGARAQIARTTLHRLSSLSSSLELVELVGHREGAGHKLVSKEDAAELEAELTAMILTADANRLATERDLLTLFAWAAQQSASAVEARLPGLAQSDAFFLRLIRSGLNEARSQSIGEVAVRRQYRLPWETLVKFLGDEQLTKRIGDFANHVATDERDQQALEVARRYASGWRPEDRW